jgi:adenine-specific DNA-methyltransferase
MYPRLKLARNLLKDDGVIFISIDDNEVANLRKVCDEIFGEENFVGNIIWEKKFAPSNDAKWFSDNHDHILIYAKNKEIYRPILLERNEEALKRYKNPDNDIRGPWVSGDMTVKTYNPNTDFTITVPSGREVNPPKGVCWRFSKEKVAELIEDDRVWFGEDGNNVPRLKRFLSEVKEGITPLTIWYHKDVGHNQEAAQEVRKLFEGTLFFDTPKPERLLKRIIHLSSKQDDIVLDFFSGSATTAHATMQLNSEDGGNRKFICVQLPEATPPDSEARKAGYKTIADIAKERIRRAGAKIKSEIKEDLFTKEGKSLDIGFRVFKLDSSNIKAWDGDVKDFQQNLLSASENIKTNRTEEDVLYEILLKSGLDLAQPIEEKTIAGKKVFNIGVGALFICLADDLNTDVAEGIGKWKQELEPAICRVIFKDTGFTDVEKTNSIQILKRYGITEVNTI